MFNLNLFKKGPLLNNRQVTISSCYSNNKYLYDKNGSVIAKKLEDISDEVDFDNIIFTMEWTSNEEYRFRSKSGKYFTVNAKGEIKCDEKKGTPFKLEQLKRNKYSIKRITGSCLRYKRDNNTVKFEKKLNTEHERWYINDSYLIKLNIYSKKYCPIKYITVQIDDIHYCWNNKDEIKILTKKPKQNELDCTTKTELVHFSKDDIEKKLNKIKGVYGHCVYHLLKKNENDFTTDLLKEFGDIFNDEKRYFDETRNALPKIIENEKCDISDKSSLIDIIRRYDDGDPVSNDNNRMINNYVNNVLLKKNSISIAIKEQSVFEKFKVLLQMIATIGIIAVLNKFGIDRHLHHIVHVSMLLSWFLSQFVISIYNEDSINKKINKNLIEIHSSLCALIVLYSLYIICYFHHKNHWKYSLQIAFKCICLSLINYIVFYFNNKFSDIIMALLLLWWILIPISGSIKMKHKVQIESQVNSIYNKKDDKIKNQIVIKVQQQLKCLKTQENWNRFVFTLFVFLFFLCFVSKMLYLWTDLPKEQLPWNIIVYIS